LYTENLRCADNLHQVPPTAHHFLHYCYFTSIDSLHKEPKAYLDLLLTIDSQGRRTPKQPTTPTAQDDQSESPSTVRNTPVIAQPKPRAQKPIEIKMMETQQQQQPPPQSHVPIARPPEAIPPAPRVVEARTSTRPFPCCFAQYNCGSAFTSKNEWKRHISTKHIQLGFWRCDMCPPSPGIDHPVYNDFNRKDLFTQHLRRMHAVPATVAAAGQDGKESTQPAPPNPTPAPAPAPGAATLSDEQIADIQKRCYRQLRAPPEVSSCVFCNRTFSGPNSWEERLEHVGGHLERDRKNGTSPADVVFWRSDDQLRDYLIVEGLVEVDPRGGYRIGDGKPKRPVEIEGYAGQQPTAQLTPRPAQVVDTTSGAAQNDGNVSEGSNGKRRRGRPPKRTSDAMDIDPPSFNHAAQNHNGRRTPQPSISLEEQIRRHNEANPHQQIPPQYAQRPQQQPHQQHQQHQHQHQPQPQPQQQHPPLHQPGPIHDMNDGRYSMPSSQPPPQNMPAPANLQPMYEFRHGTFTKFQGTSPNSTLAPRPPQELPPPALSTRAHGQPQLAPKPSPDPRDGPAGLPPGAGQQLAPRPLSNGPPGSVSPMAPTHHSGFKPINEPRAPVSLPNKGPILVAPKPASHESHDGVSARSSQDGGRQLAPKPTTPVAAREDGADSGDGVVTRRQTATGGTRPSTPQHNMPHQAPPVQQALSGAELEESRRANRGKSFREVVMS
jgi:hypothetical protein